MARMKDIQTDLDEFLERQKYLLPVTHLVLFDEYGREQHVLSNTNPKLNEIWGAIDYATVQGHRVCNPFNWTLNYVTKGAPTRRLAIVTGWDSILLSNASRLNGITLFRPYTTRSATQITPTRIHWPFIQYE